MSTFHQFYESLFSKDVVPIVGSVILVEIFLQTFLSFGDKKIIFFPQVMHCIFLLNWFSSTSSNRLQQSFLDTSRNSRDRHSPSWSCWIRYKRGRRLQVSNFCLRFEMEFKTFQFCVTKLFNELKIFIQHNLEESYWMRNELIWKYKIRYDLKCD